MRKERMLFIVGIWVAVLPFLGFPLSWKKIFFLITGCLIVLVASLFYNQAKARLSKNDNRSKVFVDNIGSGE